MMENMKDIHEKEWNESDIETIKIFEKNRNVLRILGKANIMDTSVGFLSDCIEIAPFEEEVDDTRLTLSRDDYFQYKKSKKISVRYKILEVKHIHGWNGEPDDVYMDDHSEHDTIENALLEALKIAVGWELQNDYESAFWNKEAQAQKEYEEQMKEHYNY